MGRYNDPLQREYPLRIRLFGFLTIIFVAGLFLCFPRSDGNSVVYGSREVLIPKIVDLPPLTDWKEPPRIPRALIPVNPGEGSEVESFPEHGSLGDIPLIPRLPLEIPPPGFISHDKEPEPIGGYGALMKNVHYPEMAVKVGLEGRVVVQAYIDERGFVRRTLVYQGLPGTGLDEAAVRAIERTRFHPAMQRDIPVGVWIAIPVVFQIRD